MEQIEDFESVLEVLPSATATGPSPSTTEGSPGININSADVILIIGIGSLIAACLLMIIVLYLVIAINAQVRKRGQRKEYNKYLSGSRIVNSKEMEYESISETEGDDDSDEEEEEEDDDNKLPTVDEEENNAVEVPAEVVISSVQHDEVNDDAEDGYDDYDDEEHIYDVPPELGDEDIDAGRVKQQRRNEYHRRKHSGDGQKGNTPAIAMETIPSSQSKDDVGEHIENISDTKNKPSADDMDEVVQDETSFTQPAQSSDEGSSTDQDDSPPYENINMIDKSLEDIQKSIEDMQGAVNNEDHLYI